MKSDSRAAQTVKPRVLAVGDIHGCLTAFETLLECMAPRPEDEIVLLGDYVDRGPNSKGVIDCILHLKEAHHLVCLMGNHDELMLKARQGMADLSAWLSFGGDKTLESYRPPGQKSFLTDVPATHWSFLESCLDYYETESHIFVHAMVKHHLPLNRQDKLWLRWQKLEDPLPHISGKIVVCGHTAQKSGNPLDLRHVLCIDTYVYGTGWLTGLDVLSGEIWQADEGGMRRELNLERLRR